MDDRMKNSFALQLRRLAKSVLANEAMPAESLQESLRELSVDRAFWSEKKILVVIEAEADVAGIKDEFQEMDVWLHSYVLVIVSTMSEAVEIIKRERPFALLTDLYLGGSPDGITLACLALSEGCGRIIVYPNLGTEDTEATRHLTDDLFLVQRRPGREFEALHLVWSHVRHNKCWDPTTRALVGSEWPLDPRKVYLRSWFTAMRDSGFFLDLPPDGWGEVDSEAYR